MDYVLTTNALSKKYGAFKALDAVSMHVPKGAIYGFVGKNGAGKTTLIRLVCGLQTATSGEYTLYGRKNTDKESQYHQLCWWFAITPPGSFVFPPKGGLTNRSFLLLVTA